MLAFAAAVAAMFVSGAARLGRRVASVVVGKFRVWKIAYRAHNGSGAHAYVACRAPTAPARAADPARDLAPRPRRHRPANMKLWGQLPAVGSSRVVSPDGPGSRAANYSWGSAGQIADFARMPQIVHAHAAVGAHRRAARSMRSAGAWAARRRCSCSRATRTCWPGRGLRPGRRLHAAVPRVPAARCSKACQKTWDGPVGRSLQELARAELGGSPTGTR